LQQIDILGASPNWPGRPYWPSGTACYPGTDRQTPDRGAGRKRRVKQVNSLASSAPYISRVKVQLQPLVQLLASGAAHQRCYVRRRKRVEGDRAKVAEEEVRPNELRARSRAGKERLARISERTLQEWQRQRTMDGGRISISQPKKRRRKRLRKHNGLAPGGGSAASYFSVVPPSSPGSSAHPPCAGVTSGARAAASAALVARSAKVAAALCSVRVWRIFRAINEFGACWGRRGC
jgi:hypothetical protein